MGAASDPRVYLSTTLRAKVASMPRSFANFEAVFAKKEEKVSLWEERARVAREEREFWPRCVESKVVEEREGFLERFAAELSALEAKVQDFASEARGGCEESGARAEREQSESSAL